MYSKYFSLWLIVWANNLNLPWFVGFNLISFWHPSCPCHLWTLFLLTNPQCFTCQHIHNPLNFNYKKPRVSCGLRISSEHGNFLIKLVINWSFCHLYRWSFCLLLGAHSNSVNPFWAWCNTVKFSYKKRVDKRHFLFLFFVLFCGWNKNY